MGKMKAMEGCLGEEVVKDHMVKMKRSAAKCMKVDTPELELPMFDNTFRFANAMARSPRRGQGSGFKNIMETFMKMQMFSQMMDSGDSPSNFISKRAADEDAYELGDKLHKKLEHKKEEMHDMYGNMTCMLRECNVLDSENKFYPEGIKMEFDEMKVKDAWLKAQLGKYCDQCIELAEAVPQSMLDDCALGWRDGQDQVLHEVHDDLEDQDLHALRHQAEARGELRPGRQSRGGDQDSRESALRDCEDDA